MKCLTARATDTQTTQMLTGFTVFLRPRTDPSRRSDPGRRELWRKVTFEEPAFACADGSVLNPSGTREPWVPAGRCYGSGQNAADPGGVQGRNQNHPNREERDCLLWLCYRGPAGPGQTGPGRAQQLTVLGCCLHTKSDRKSNSFWPRKSSGSS